MDFSFINAERVINERYINSSTLKEFYFIHTKLISTFAEAGGSANM